MPKLYEILSPTQRLELAVRGKPPHLLAETFATFVGQFYDRSEFDNLARQVRDLYRVNGTGQAGRFQSHLDRRLYDRYRAPVAWEVESPASGRAA